ncbi:unnamed protein product [marine sediment metagenome]|uniref:Uncharacterized protein n=1 Tax=marine sediment metagenome TaxID=412755 RepID=X1J0J4_9ZZZZ
MLNSVPNGTNKRFANILEPLISSYERAVFLPKFEASMFLSVNWDIIIPLISRFAIIINKKVVKFEKTIKNINEA